MFVQKILYDPLAWRHIPLIRALIKGTRSFVARALRKCAHAGTSSYRTWFVNNYSIMATSFIYTLVSIRPSHLKFLTFQIGPSCVHSNSILIFK
jgi:hypothetical protein